METRDKKSDINFKIDDKEYDLIVDGETVDGFIIDNGLKKEIESEEDKALVESVLGLLRPNLDDSVEVDTVNIDGREYTIFLDKKRFVYFFYEIDGSLYKEPPKDVVAKLNFMFNHMPDVKNSSLENKIESPVEFQRKIRVGNKIVAVFITVTMVLNMLPREHKWKVDYAIKNCTADIEDFLNSIDFVEYQSGLVENAIQNNPNLTDEEKAFLANLGSVVEENLDYISIDDVLDNLKELRISYVEESKNNDNSNYTLGEYRPCGSEKNSITIYHSTGFSDASKNVIMHEVVHSFSCESTLTNLPTPFGEVAYLVDTSSVFRINILEELANELFGREYLCYLTDENITYVGYDTFMPLMYALCEIIDPEVIREYKFTHDASGLIKALESIDGDVDKAYSFLTAFTTLSMYHSNVYNNQSEENILLYYNKAQDMYRTVQYYYKLKHGITIESDIVTSLYFYGTIYSNETISKNVKEYFNLTNHDRLSITPRSYLAKKGNQCMTVVCSSNNGQVVYTLDDSNRYLDSKYSHDFLLKLS